MVALFILNTDPVTFMLKSFEKMAPPLIEAVLFINCEFVTFRSFIPGR